MTTRIVALMNDLHKGRDSRAAWSWVIDLSAYLMLLVSFTGILLLLYLKKQRSAGLFTAIAGAILLAVAWVLWVP